MAKTIILIFAVIAVLVLVYINPFGTDAEAPAEALATSMAVVVPEAINTAIAVGMAALLAMGAAYLFEATGLDLRGYTAPIAITLGAFIAGELQNVVNMVPEVYDPTLNLLFKIIVLIIAPVGALALRTRPAVPGRLL